MAKKKDQETEGSIERKVDFNLKKEDLMLLILEGRKEVMEEELSKLQSKQRQLTEKMTELQSKFREEMKKKVYATITPEMKKFASVFTDEETIPDDEDAIKRFNIAFSEYTVGNEYILYKAVPLNLNSDVRSSAIVKSEVNATINVKVYSRVTVSFNVKMPNKPGVEKDVIYNTDPRPPYSDSRSYTIAEVSLNMERQKELESFKQLKAVAEELAKLSSLSSEAVVEYELFNKNKDRSKASMIKEVLNRDEKGRELVSNIVAASKGMKLLS